MTKRWKYASMTSLALMIGGGGVLTSALITTSCSNKDHSDKYLSIEKKVTCTLDELKADSVQIGEFHPADLKIDGATITGETVSKQFYENDVLFALGRYNKNADPTDIYNKKIYLSWNSFFSGKELPAGAYDITLELTIETFVGDDCTYLGSAYFDIELAVTDPTT